MTNPRNTTRGASHARPLRRTILGESHRERRHTQPVQRGNTGETTSGTGGSRNGKTANRLSECTLGIHCRRRCGESVPHITLLSWVVAERIADRGRANTQGSSYGRALQCLKDRDQRVALGAPVEIGAPGYGASIRARSSCQSASGRTRRVWSGRSTRT